MTNYFTPIDPPVPEWALEQACKAAELRIEDWHNLNDCHPLHKSLTAHARLIEQHEAFKQDVSDAVNKVRDCWGHSAWPSGYACNYLDCFRLDRPKPDPLAEALLEISGEGGYDNFDHYAYRLRSALEARGVELREIEG